MSEKISLDSSVRYFLISCFHILGYIKWVTFIFLYFLRCIIIFLLIINSLHLKRVGCSKIYLFFAKNRRFNDFFIGFLRTEGKRQKRPFQAPTDLVYKDRACRGLFRQNGL